MKSKNELYSFKIKKKDSCLSIKINKIKKKDSNLDR
jgi:hypothetical protein